MKYLYTANTGSISKIDTDTNTMLEEIKVDGMAHNVQVSPDNRILGVTVMNHHHGMGKALFVDIESDKIVSEITLSEHPAHIDFTKDNKYAVVTSTGDDQVFVIDLSTYSVKGTIGTGKGPHGIRISKDGLAFVANMNVDTVSVLDVENMKEIKKIQVGNAPVQTAVTSNGEKLLVSLSETDELAIVDLATEAVTKLPVGTTPIQMFIQSDDQFAYVANQENKEKPGNTVSRIDLESNEVSATVKVGNGAHGVVIEKEGKFVYVTNMYDNTVSVIDTATNSKVKVIEVGENPNGVTFKN